jgi:hypothetical protein
VERGVRKIGLGFEGGSGGGGGLGKVVDGKMTSR